jgi:hypothetical protein
MAGASGGGIGGALMPAARMTSRQGHGHTLLV